MKKFIFFILPAVGPLMMLLGAVAFFIAAVRGDSAMGFPALLCLGYGVYLHILTMRKLPKRSPVEPGVLEDMVGMWLIRRDERRELAQERLELGILHAQANRKVVILEEELIMRFPGQQVTLPDNRVATIGTPGCRLADRMRVSS